MKPLLELAKTKLRGQRVVAVMSNKGGVGKSVVAAALAMAKPNTALIDLDLSGTAIAKLFGLVGKLHRVEKEGIEPFEIEGVKIFTLGGVVGDRYVVLPGYAEGGVVESFLGLLKLDGVDTVVIDMPPGMGEELLSLNRITAFEPAVVTTPSRLSYGAVKHLVDYLIDMGRPPKYIILNMAYVECGYVLRPYGQGVEIKELAKSTGAFLIEVPIDPALEDYVGRFHQYRGPLYRAVERVWKL
ncbi:MAG: P-loop NTPase [Candidatus Aenigmatarchaeota archaeon]